MKQTIFLLLMAAAIPSTLTVEATPTAAVRAKALQILGEAFPGELALLAPLDDAARQEKLDAEMLSAARFGHFERMQSLLVAGARVDAADRDGNTALIWAAWHHSKWAVELLLARGADVNHADKRGTTALMRSASFSSVLGGGADVVALLLVKGARIDAQDKDGRTALHQACERGYEASVPTIQLLLRAGADTALADVLGRTAFLTAAASGNVEVLKALAAAGADARALDKKGATALMIAVDEGRILGLKYLLSLKVVAVDARDTAGSTALLRAAKTGQSSAAGLLLDAGADINGAGSVSVDPFEQEVVDHTPLMVAARFARVELVKLLLSRQAAIDYRGSQGLTALGIARLYGADSAHQQVAKLLLEAGAKD